MNFCGIILAKQESTRLPNKNFLEVKNGLKMYQMAVNALPLDSEDIYIFSHLHGNRPEPAQIDEPIWQTLKWAYKSLPKRYDAIINIMANCPQHTKEGTLKAMGQFESVGCQELRSFTKKGIESGLMIVSEKYLLEKHEVSTYQSAIQLDSIEIHTQEDLEQWVSQ